MKKVSALLLSAVMLATVIFPVTTQAASYESKLNKLKVSNVKTYDVAVPKKGVKKTKKQINELLKKIKGKLPGKGNTVYTYTLSFSKEKKAKKDTYLYVYKTKSWSNYNAEKMTARRNEEVALVEHYPSENSGKAFVSLCILKKKKDYYYNWIMGTKTGDLTVEKPKETNETPAKKKNYKLYKDQKVAGQTCMVYSYDIYLDDGKYTDYLYISRKTGVTVKSVFVGKTTLYTSITFVNQKMKKPASFYQPPKDVKFTKYVVE